jgi:hypothetical protein
MFQGKRPFLTGLLTVNRGYHDSWLMNPTNICAALSSAHGFLKHCRMLRRATRLPRWPRSGFVWPLKPERDKASSMTSGSYRRVDRSRRQVQIALAAFAPASSQGFQIAFHKLHDEFFVAGVPPAIAVDAADQHLTIMIDFH